MAKSVSPGTVNVPGIGEFAATALPDSFDARDLAYRPRLQRLPDALDQRPDHIPYVMRQEGNSCTGHALAAVINTVLMQTGASPPVSPYMLYHLARRYDEFEGDNDVGSSLRGALKGWYHHGVLPLSRWPGLDALLDLYDEVVVEEANERPLGAFYRVNPYRLDDMQSAISELNAICASALIHDGWLKPAVISRDGHTMHVIARPVDARALGGHAFAMVGYNEVGFLVQNSWGPDWGRGGFATLPYEDWLESAYDAWVARPGVPHTPFTTGRSGTVLATGGRLVTGPAPDLRRLARHVVNLGNDGRLSSTGRFTSSPAQIDSIFAHMDRWHRLWVERNRSPKRHIVLFAHGGLNSEALALDVAQENLNWWLNNNVYPIYFAWQSGVSETLLDHLTDTVRQRLPFAFGFDVVEAIDRAVERIARRTLRWAWEEMKENARAACGPIEHGKPPPGATLMLSRLRDYVHEHGADNVAVHLVGHSAGAIFHAALLRPLVQVGIRIASVTFLAPALTVAGFVDEVLPPLENDQIGSFTTFNLSETRELDDTCGPFYHKSILYLVSRALEGDKADRDVPLLGMERFVDDAIPGGPGHTLRQVIERAGGEILFSPRLTPATCRTEARAHGGFAGDPPTMTSVVMRIRGLTTPQPENEYRRNAALIDAGAVLIDHDGRRPAPVMADTQEPGERPLVVSAEPAPEGALAPEQPGVRAEVAFAPASGSPVLDILYAHGWHRGQP